MGQDRTGRVTFGMGWIRMGHDGMSWGLAGIRWDGKRQDACDAMRWDALR